MYLPNSQNRVLLELLPKFQESSDWLSQIYFKSANGNLAPLDTIASRVERAGPQQINHFGQLPAVTLGFDIKPGVSLGQAVHEVEDLAARTLAPTITTGFQGTAKVFRESLQNMTLLLILATAVVYIVLGVLYESYIHPLTILSGLPSAGFGALLTLYIFKYDLNIYGYVGLIMLIGLVKKNAIMQIDVALDCERNKGMSPVDAVYEGCIVRFRPIMMTTMAALFSALPIALGRGAGGEARASLGMSVVGGLIFSQLITLYLTPVVYTYLEGIVSWARSRKKGPALTPAPAPAGD
jgi:HAE1 family hydrophobic/amphiphilic exporter-1